MCGITGFLHFDRERRAGAEVVKKMSDCISHRGPDAEGFFQENNIALGHRRLSIIDLSSGAQPMHSTDDNIVLIFNGEIYNYVELREELIKLGCRFVTHSDTEVIIHAYKVWGVECQQHFNGMWAFALWDKQSQRLLVSRDRIGEKPLYYSLSDDTFIFGSEIKSIFAYGIPKIPNTDLLEIYLSLGYIPAPFTFYKNIHKLKAGHCLVITGKDVKEHQYWDLPEIDEDNMLTDKQTIYEHFEGLLKDSVKIRMQSDVPYGAFLSGGLDSSTVVAYMSEISQFPVETFTIGFQQKDYDERDLARLVSEKFHTNHHEQVVEPGTFNISLDKVAYHYDEPFGDSSSIPTGYVSKFASAKVKMVLTGDGGDELLAGYNSYQSEKISAQYCKLPGWVRNHLPQMVSAASKPFKNSIRYKLNRVYDVCYSSNLSFEDRYLSKAASLDLPTIKAMTKGEKTYPVEDFLRDFMSKCTYKDTFYKLMYLNLKLSLPDDMLVKVDRMSMAYSLETRAPFLDHRLIDYMTHVHKDVKMPRLERKSVLRNVIAPKLPAALLHAPKRGFSVPLHEWFKDNSFVESLNNLAKSMPLLDNNLVKEVISRNNSGKRNLGSFIWRLFILKKALAGFEENSYQKRVSTTAV